MEIGTQLALEDLPKLNLDLNTPEVDEFIKLTEPFIDQDDLSTEQYFGNKDNSELYQNLMRNCKAYAKFKSFFFRSIFIPDPDREIFQKALDSYNEFQQKFEGKKVPQTVKEKFQIIVSNLIEIFKYINTDEIKNVLNYSIGNTLKELKAIREQTQELITSNTEYASDLDEIEKILQELNTSIQNLSALLTPDDIKEFFDKLKNLGQPCEKVNNLAKIQDNKFNDWFLQTNILMIDFKTMLLGHALYENCSIILETLNTEPVHIPTRTPHPNGNYIPEYEESESEVINHKEEEYSEAALNPKEEEDENEEDIQDYEEGNDEEIDEDEEEHKKSSKGNRAHRLHDLIEPLLALDCASESPVLASFWVSKLSEMTHPSNSVILQSMQSVFNEMQHFFDRLDLAMTAASFLVDLQELELLVNDFRARQTTGEFSDSDDIITLFGQFVKDCYMIKSPISRITTLIKPLETGRTIKKMTENIPEPFNRCKELFFNLFNTIIPISQMVRAIDGLNNYATEFNLKIDQLVLKFPLIQSYEVGPYIRSPLHIHEVNSSYANFVADLANKVEASGIQIINNKKNEPFSVDKLIVPSLYVYLNDLGDLINKTFEGMPRFNAFAKDLTEKIVDGSILLAMIKEIRHHIIVQKSMNNDTSKFEMILHKLTELNNLHQLYYALELGGLITYSNALHFTYMRMFAHFVSNEEIFEGQSLLEPASCKLLIDVQRLMQNKLQSDMVRQRISLLNTMKMSLGNILGAAFMKEDCPEFNDLVQWIDIVSQLCRMTDVDGVQQIKPMCINLPRLVEFPNLADDLWKLVEAPVLCERENRAIEHMQMVCQAEFNGEDVTSSFSNLGHFRILAMTRDYTSLLSKVKDDGFVTIDNDYVLGNYSNDYANRFIEHHWKINICQIDDIARDIKRQLPPFDDETEKVHSTFALLTFGGLSLETVIAFGKTALNLRKKFANREEFTKVYRKLHTLVSFLEHHDTLSLLIGEISDSQLVKLSLCRTFNYLRFVKYVTSLALRLSSAGAFTNDTTTNLFTQCLGIRHYASTLKPTMRLTVEAIEKLANMIAVIDGIFTHSAINYDNLFGKLKLFVKTIALKNSEKIYQLITKLEQSINTATPTDIVQVYHEVNRLIEPNEKDLTKEIIAVLKVILAITRLKGVVDPANQFLENDGLAHFTFQSLDDVDIFTETSRYTSNKVSHAFAIPRPKLTVHSTTLPLHDQLAITDIFEQMQTERESIFHDAAEYQDLVMTREVQKKELFDLQTNRKKLIEEFNGLKDGLSSAIGADSASEQKEQKGQSSSTSTRRNYDDYRRLLSFVEITDNRLTQVNESLIKKSEGIKTTTVDLASIPSPSSSPLFNEDGAADDNIGSLERSKSKEIQDTMDAQLINVLKKIGYTQDV